MATGGLSAVAGLEDVRAVSEGAACSPEGLRSSAAAALRASAIRRASART